MSRNALRRAIQRTSRYQWGKLLAEESRWQRKQTIATNKLKTIRKQKDKFVLAQIEANEERKSC